MSMSILNNPNSSNGIDMQTTAFGCVGIVNGVFTVCYYISNLLPNHYTVFPSAKGLHVQTHDNTNPMAVYNYKDGKFQITVDKATHKISIEAWSGPTELAEGQEPPTEMTPDTPKESGKPGILK